MKIFLSKRVHRKDMRKKLENEKIKIFIKNYFQKKLCEKSCQWGNTGKKSNNTAQNLKKNLKNGYHQKLS